MRNTFPSFRPCLHLCCGLFILLSCSTTTFTFGQTSFAPAQDFPYPYNSNNTYFLPILNTADINGDNKKDIIVSNIDGVVWYKNAGNNNFSYILQITDNNQYNQLFPNDIDQDGDQDLICINTFEGIIDYYTNNGNAEFSDVQNVFVIDNIPPSSFDHELSHINMTDLDNDNDNDMLYYQIGNNLLTWRTNNGNGNFSQEHHIDTLTAIYTIIILDFNSDNNKDIIAVSPFEQITFVYVNDGSGNFSKTQLNNTSLSNINANDNVSTIDVNGDGIEDIVTNIAWYENQDNGNFSTAQAIGNGNNGFSSFNIQAADMDNDGDNDLIRFGSLETDNGIFPFQAISWYENNDASFNQHLIDTMMLLLPSTENLYDAYNDLFLVDDFDNDGDFDIVAYSFVDEDILIYENLLDTPTPTIPPTAAFTTTPTPQTTDTLRLCEGQSISFLNQSQNANAYLWNFGDGTATTTQINPQHSFQQAGTYTVSLVAAQNAPLTFECEANAGELVQLLDQFYHYTANYNDSPNYSQSYLYFDDEGNLIGNVEIGTGGSLFAEIGATTVAAINYPTVTTLNINTLNELNNFANNTDCVDMDVYDACEVHSIQVNPYYSAEYGGYVIIVTIDYGWTIPPPHIEINPANENIGLLALYGVGYYTFILGNEAGTVFSPGDTATICPFINEETLLYSAGSCCKTFIFPDTIPGGGNQSQRILPKTQKQIPTKTPTKPANNNIFFPFIQAQPTSTKQKD